MCLVLGCAGTGKTLLLKRLHQSWGSRPASSSAAADLAMDIPSTVPTVGTELVTLSARGRGSASSGGEFTLREVGGSMAPIWHNYYKGCAAVIFVIDLSNRVQVSAAGILLYQVSSKTEDCLSVFKWPSDS